ncbi:T9SS type B sorting domain-containing protein [Thalassobellus sediminis]|uniref:T9SS type B sorting domain-containing protein n=1 Tax=Thalassobellus sediminis TaxID=3367753 RepID=UPI0037A6028A
MRIFLFIFISFLLCFQSVAQNYEWTKTTGSQQYEELVSLASDVLGNTYSTGYFVGTVDFDPGPNVFNLSAEGGMFDYNIFVQKLDPLGNFIWAKSISGVEYDDGKSITIDSSGNLIITGRTDIPSTDFVGDEIIIFKLDPQGNTLFSKVFGGNRQDFGSSVVVDATDNIYLIGLYSGTVDFDPGAGTFNLTSNGADIFIQKLNSNGEFVWAKSIGGSGLDLGRHLNIDTQENLYITGFFENTCDFDPGVGISNMTSNGSRDAFIVKLNNYGELLWHKGFGASDIDDATSSVIDSNGNVIITGHFSESVDFDPNGGVYNLTSNGEDDVFVLKLDSNGEFVWANSFGTIYYDVGQSIDIDTSDEIYVTGGLFDPIGYDPNAIIPIANYDVFIHKYSSDGNLLWEIIRGGPDSDMGTTIHIDDFFNIYVGGHFHETVDFDPDDTNIDNFTSNGYADHFITKYSQETEEPIAYPVDTLIGCDDNMDGYSEYFDTFGVEDMVLGNQIGLIVTYYDENNNLLPSPLSNPFTNTSANSQNITIRVTDPVSLLYDETVLELQIISTPSVNQPSNLFACDDGNGFANFDTSNVQNEIIGSQTGLQILYFDQNGNQLTSPLSNSIQNTIPYQETIIAQISNNNSPTCYTQVNIDLIVQPVPSVFPVNNFYECDDNTDGIASFNLSSVESIALGGQAGMTIEYYDSDGILLPNPLPNPYVNSIPNQETITARITNPNTNCYNESTFDLIVNPLPEANQLQIIYGCDDNNDGISEHFDTSNVESQVLNGQTGISVNYFDQLGNELPNPLPNPYTNFYAFNELINVRVTANNTTCYAETTLQLQTVTQPNINQPNNLYACDQGNGYAEFNTSIIEQELIGNQTGLTIQYFDSNNNPLPSPLPTIFQNTEPFSQTINIRIEDASNPICYSETSFNLIVNELPEINLEDEYFICNLDPSISLNISAGHNSYNWFFEDGTLISSTNSAEITEEGSYTLTVTQIENGITCENSFDFNLVRSVLPEIQQVNYGELGNNYIEIIASGDGDFEYSIDEINYQNSNYFSNIQGGIYIVIVRDKYGCGENSDEVIIIDYPKFFTPNNDGYNDFWQIKGISHFPNSRTLIFDRYGKLLARISANELGWNGLYNGKQMMSNDYWFRTDLGNGQTFSGHFSLKR